MGDEDDPRWGSAIQGESGWRSERRGLGWRWEIDVKGEHGKETGHGTELDAASGSSRRSGELLLTRKI
jgi:hypothetical protein